MSRSYKKNFWTKEYNKGSKKQASRITRRSLNKLDAGYKGNRHKKVYCSWEISDYRFHCSWEQFRKWNWPSEEFETEEAAWAYWKSKYGSK